MDLIQAGYYRRSHNSAPNRRPAPTTKRQPLNQSQRIEPCPQQGQSQPTVPGKVSRLSRQMMPYRPNLIVDVPDKPLNPRTNPTARILRRKGIGRLDRNHDQRHHNRPPDPNLASPPLRIPAQLRRIRSLQINRTHPSNLTAHPSHAIPQKIAHEAVACSKLSAYSSKTDSSRSKPLPVLNRRCRCRSVLSICASTTPRDSSEPHA